MGIRDDLVDFIDRSCKACKEERIRYSFKDQDDRLVRGTVARMVDPIEVGFGIGTYAVRLPCSKSEKTGRDSTVR